jgi:hypothetical protein
MIKFPVPTEPFADESLMGFIARACDRNGHSAIGHVLELAGYRTHKSHFLASKNEVDLSRLAEFFGCSPDTLKPRFHAEFAVEGGGTGFVNFLGVPIRSKFREPTLRRMSPASLRKSPYHRASWLLKPLCYCPESGELLIGHCPNPGCAKALGWRRTSGIPYCEHCLNEEAEPQIDLRTYDLPKLVGEELESYKSIANLVIKPSEIAGRMPPTFSSWKPWEIFDLVVLLSSVLSKRFSDRHRVKKQTLVKLPDWHENFMMAGRAILGWPKAFDLVIETMRASKNNRGGHYGRNKEVGDFALDLRRKYNASSKACGLVAAAIDEFYISKGRPSYRTLLEAETSADKWISGNIVRKVCTNSDLLRSLIKYRDVDILRAESPSGDFRPDCRVF